VRPATVADYRTVVMKNSAHSLVYALMAGNWAAQPMAYINTTSDHDVSGPTPLGVNVWTHVALTFDGAMLRLYVGGVPVAALAVSGSIAVSSGPLTIGGNTLDFGHFSGLIDDIRIYNRALSQAEIQADMTTSL
jgi:hypothetical protein